MGRRRHVHVGVVAAAHKAAGRGKSLVDAVNSGETTVDRRSLPAMYQVLGGRLAHAAAIEELHRNS